ncbi:MAG: hypothetical protein LBL83_09205 [Clostridiales bacterium]|jgi:hypothetical protein|nr:hypothetical protein [Clostridiales bacterium]
MKSKKVVAVILAVLTMAVMFNFAFADLGATQRDLSEYVLVEAITSESGTVTVYQRAIQSQFSVQGMVQYAEFYVEFYGTVVPPSSYFFGPIYYPDRGAYFQGSLPKTASGEYTDILGHNIAWGDYKGYLAEV